MIATHLNSGLFVPSPAGERESARLIPLTGVRVDARITGATQRVRVRQTYHNTSETPVEAVYVFPLEEGSAVCGFRALIDGEEIVGRVEARDDAFDVYDDAMAEGRTALLLDQERPDILTASVGNLLPKQKAIVELEYVAEVQREGGALRWRLPTTVSPRYIPERQLDFEGVADAERISPPVTSQPLPYRFELLVEAELGTPLASVESPSHKIRVEIDGGRASAQLAGDEGLMDRDFVLLLQPRSAVAPLSGTEEGPDGRRYAAVSFLPRYESSREAVEMVFLADCSGSMQGDSIEQARRTLRLCLRSLEKGDRFNIIRFGSQYEAYSERSVVYGDAELGKADGWVERMAADLGGTEIASPLAAAYRLPAADGLRRCLVLITDGQVGNEDEIIRLVAQHAGEVSVFAFGVGYGAGEYLVRGVARAGRGAAEMVYPGERAEEKILRHFQRMTSRPLEDVRIAWDGLSVEELLPGALPPVWAGESVTLFGRVAGGEKGSATLSATIGGEEVQSVVFLEASDGSGGPSTVAGAIATLWARRKIRELEESDAWTGRGGSGQRDRKAGKPEERRREIEGQLVELGKSFGLVSSATSYVLADERSGAQRAETRARLLRVPGQLTRGWGGHGYPWNGAAAMAGGGVSRGFGFLTFPSRNDDRSLAPAAARDSFRVELPTALYDSKAEQVVRSQEDPEIATALEISAGGSWAPSPTVLAFASLTRKRVEELAGLLSAPRAEEIIATLAVIVAVQRQHAELPVMWNALLRKARRWLEAQLANQLPPEGASWEEWLSKQLEG